MLIFCATAVQDRHCFKLMCTVGMYWPQAEEPAVPRPASVTSTHSGSNVSTKASSSRGKNDICVGEEVKIAVNIALERFRLSEEQKGECMM